PHRRHVPREARRALARGRALRPADHAVHRSAPVRGSDSGPGPERRPRADRPAGRRAEPDQSAVRLPLPPALSLHDGHLHAGRAAACRLRERAPRRVPPPAQRGQGNARPRHCLGASHACRRRRAGEAERFVRRITTGSAARRRVVRRRATRRGLRQAPRASVNRTEGYVPFREYRTWYRIVGEGEDDGKLPVLYLHGGPGATHDYLESLEAMAETGRRAIFYDQIGCGESDLPDDPSLWRVETFVEELDAVRGRLGLDRLHIFGNSWGGMLAMEYALTRPEGVASMIVASSPSSIPQWVAEANRLRADLPAEGQATLTRHEGAGTTDDPDYEQASEGDNPPA